MEKIKEIFKKFREQIMYIIFGVLTTIVNYVVYLALTKMMNVDYMISTVISQIVAMIFAYITNKIYVFEAKNDSFKGLIKEMVSFFSVRIVSLFLDMGFMKLFVDIMHLNDAIMKLVSNVLIIVANYIFSKLFIFKKNKKEENIKENKKIKKNKK